LTFNGSVLSKGVKNTFGTRNISLQTLPHSFRNLRVFGVCGHSAYDPLQPASVTLPHNIWCGRELTRQRNTHTDREEAKNIHHSAASKNSRA